MSVDRRLRPIKSGQTELDLVRMAALLDGEGCIHITRYKPHMRYVNHNYSLSLGLTNTDRRIIDWIVSTFGGSVYVEEAKGNKRRCYRWSCACRLAAYILGACLPYFLSKGEQAEIALQFASEVRIPGTLLSPETVAHRESLRARLSELKKLAA